MSNEELPKAGKGARGLYYIESVEHEFADEFKVWWKPGRLGYTRSLTEAGLYTKEEAEAIVNKCNSHLKEDDEPNEVMWSYSDVFDGKAGRVENVVRKP